MDEGTGGTPMGIIRVDLLFCSSIDAKDTVFREEALFSVSSPHDLQQMFPVTDLVQRRMRELEAPAWI
jgi:hypothetical protein